MLHFTAECCYYHVGYVAKYCRILQDVIVIMRKILFKITITYSAIKYHQYCIVLHCKMIISEKHILKSKILHFN